MAQEQRKLFSHKTLETNVGWLIFFSVLVISFAGLAQIVPLFFQHSTTVPTEGVEPYDSLRLVGRDIYIREGCVSCHSQQIRMLSSEVQRYGPYSLAGESVYDHPFLWGSKRTGPDLARVGGKYSDEWHVAHLIDPRSVVPESKMPAYAWLQRDTLKIDDLPAHLEAMRKVGVPYTDEMVENAARDAFAQAYPDSAMAEGVAERYGEDTNIRAFDGDPGRLTEMDALVAYLQIVGKLTDAAYQKPDGEQVVQAEETE